MFEKTNTYCFYKKFQSDFLIKYFLVKKYVKRELLFQSEALGFGLHKINSTKCFSYTELCIFWENIYSTQDWVNCGSWRYYS